MRASRSARTTWSFRDTKHKLVEDTAQLVKDYEQQYNDGLITRGEKYNKVVDAWAKATDRVAEEMMKGISAVQKLDNGRTKPMNSIYMMSHSGARGSPAQMKQLAGMRGLMAKPSGEIIEQRSSRTSRKACRCSSTSTRPTAPARGLADTALKTANSGYLTRRLVDVAQDCIVTEPDCGTDKGLRMQAVIDSGTVVATLGHRVLGRTAAEDVIAPATGKVIVPAGRTIDERDVEKIEGANVQSFRIRSVLTCDSRPGVCAKCYGRDLARGTPVNLGEAVGVIAAQSIGEPGTQLTMRTFHIGGTAQVVDQSTLEASFEGKIEIRNRNIVKDSEGRSIAMARNMQLVIIDRDGTERAAQPRHLRLPHAGRGGRQGESAGSAWPSGIPIPARSSRKSTAWWPSRIWSIVCRCRKPPTSRPRITKRVVIDWRANPRSSDLKPAIVVKGKDAKARKSGRGGAEGRYLLPVETILSVEPAPR